MSVNYIQYPNIKYQTKTLRTHSYNPKISTSYNSSTVRVGHFAQNRPTLITNKGSELKTFSSVNITSKIYFYQDEPPDSNVIFFDSNLHKYRTDSLGREQSLNTLKLAQKKKTYSSNTYTKSFNDSNKYKPNRTLNYSSIQIEGNAYKRNGKENISFSQNKSSYRRSATQTGQRNIIQTKSYQLQNKNIVSDQNRASRRTNYISSYGNRMNQNQIASNSQNKILIERMNRSHNQNINQNKRVQFDQNKSSTTNRGQVQNNYENKRINNSANITINNRYGSAQSGGRVNNLKKIDVNRDYKTNTNTINQYQNKRVNQSQENKDNKQISINKSNYNNATSGTKIQQQNSNLRDAKTILTNAKEVSNKREVKTGLTNLKQSYNQKTTNAKDTVLNSRQNTNQKVAGGVQSNIKQGTNQKVTNTQGTETNIRQNQTSSSQKDTKTMASTGRDNINLRGANNNETNQKQNQQITRQQIKENKLSDSRKDNQTTNVNKNSNKNMSVEKENKNQQQQSQSESKGFGPNSQIKKSLNYNENMKNNMEKVNANQNEDENVEIFNKHEEKIIVVLPGQTIEPKTVTETFQNPVVETVENEDGTRSSIIKQTKITTTSENVPIGSDKIRALDGAPDLPIVKQYITYEYKTVKSPGKMETAHLLKSQNKVFEEDKIYGEGYLGQNVEKRQYNEEYEDNNEKNEEQIEEQNEEEKINENSLVENEMGEFGEDGSNKPQNLKLGIKGDKVGKDVKGDIRGSGGENSKSKKLDENKEDKGGQGIKNEFDAKQKTNSKSKKLTENKEDKGDQGIKNGFEAKQKTNSKSKKLDENKEDKGDQGIKNEFDAKQKTNSKSKKLTENKEDKGDEEIKNEFDSKQITNSKEEKIGDIDAAVAGGVQGSSKKSAETKKEKKKGGKKEENFMAGIQIGGSSQLRNKKGSYNKKSNKTSDPFASFDDKLKGSSKKKCEGAQKSKEEKTIEEIIKKGDSATKDEKQKMTQFLLDLYGKCCLEGEKEGSEKILEKLAKLLIIFGEKDKNEILSKLSSSFPQKQEIYKMLLEFMSRSGGSPKSKGGKKDKKNLSKSFNKKSIKKDEGVKFDTDFMKGLDFGKINKGKKKTTSSALLDFKLTEVVEVKNVAPLKFDGLFLEIKESKSNHHEKNPFTGISSFYKFYKERKKKIKKKILNMASGEVKEEKK